ncbi:MAG: diguanylate cyclase, partial [Spirochaetes bacterium]|nr:diguanylate cyclase [Spirochaetota bacterium]
LGRYKETISSFMEYLEISEKIKDDYGTCSSESSIGLAYLELGDFDKAEEWFRRSIGLSEEKKILYIMCYAYIHMGELLLEKKEWNESIEYLKKAEKLYKENNFLKDWTSILYHHMADAYIEEYKEKNQGIELKEKKEKIKQIKKTCKKALKEIKHWANHYSAALRVTGKYYALIKKKTKAQRFFKKSINHAHLINRPYELGRSLYEYGDFLDSIGKNDQARTRWQEAFDIFNEINARLYMKRCSDKLGLKATPEEVEEITPQDRLKAERKMTTVLDTSRYLSSILDLDELLDKIMTRTIELVGAERGILFLYPEEKEARKKLQIRVMKNVGKREIEGEGFGMSWSIIEKVEDQKKPLIIEDAGTDAQFKGQVSVVRYGLKSIICAPIMSRGEMLGVIYLDNRLVSGLFSQEDLMVLDLVSGQAGVSIENARLYRRAVTDGLTGLYNRIFFDNYLMQSVEQAEKYNKALSLVIIDIDHFKNFNDEYGHQAGDLIITFVSDVIKEQTRKSDIPCRYGGDEFVLILPETDIKGARITAEKIWSMIKDNSVLYNMGKKVIELKVTLSIGISQLEEGQDRLAFLEKADKALYEAKEKGRDSIVVSGSGSYGRRMTRIKKIKRTQKERHKEKTRTVKKSKGRKK